MYIVDSLPQNPICTSPDKMADVTLSAPDVSSISTSSPSSLKYPLEWARYWGA